MADKPQEPVPHLADRNWIDVQKKTFTNWVNDHLKDTGLSVEDLQVDLDSGVVLVKLLEALAPGKKMPGKYNTKPRMMIHKSQNLTIAFKFMTVMEKIPLVNIGPSDIMEHNLKLILGLVWSLILRYQIASAPAPSQKEGEESKRKRISAKKLLLGWVNATLPDQNITNLTTDWKDGTNLSALVDDCRPGLIPNHASLDPNNRLENISNAMNLAQDNFGIPQVMHPEDLAVEKPDELSVMTYLSYFCRPDSIGQQVLLEWIQKQIPHKGITNFNTDWVDGRALGALTDVVSGGDFPEEEQMVPQRALQNTRESMDAAENLIGVKKNVSPEEFTNPDLDQLTRMTYLTQFRHAKSTSASPASKLRAAGPGIQGDFAERETNFVVRGRVPEWAKLNTTVLAPSGEQLPLKEERVSDRATTYKYTPVSAGTHTVVVMLDQEHIPGSPFSVSHSTPSDASMCAPSGDGLKKARVAETADFSVNCESSGPGELQVEIHGPTGNVGTDITEPKDRDFKVEFTALEPGPHTIAVKWGGQHIPNSPFTCLVTDPRKCTATGAGLTRAKVGEPGHFTVKTEKAGPGTLTAEAEGPNGYTVPVQIRDEGRGNYTCTWIPKDEGPHKLDVKWSGAPISGSPFKVNAESQADPSKCQISNLPTETLRAGKVSTFSVDTRKAGSGELKAAAHGPSVPEKCEVVEKDPGVYAVNFTPMEVGKLTVDVSYNHDPIPGSPCTFKVNDPTKCKVNAAAIAEGSYQVNQPVDFRVSTQFAGEGELTATSRGPKGEEKLDITDQGDGNYLVHYSPTDVGPHAIDIRFDDEQIPDVPVRLFVEAGPSADSVVVTQPVPDRYGAFIVGHDYPYKVNAVGAGDAELTATSYGARTGQKPAVKVVDVGNGRYDVTLNAKEPDDYNVNIMWGDEHVPGSPFKLTVKDKSRAEKVVCSGPHYGVGKTDPVTLDIDTEKAGAGKLDVTSYGDKTGSVPVDVVERAPNKYTASFVPPSLDVYFINVLWSDEAVKDSPFKVNLLPPDASKCVVTGPTVPAEGNKPVEVRIDATEAGNGKLAATAVGEKAGPTDVKIREVEPNVFDVSFIPPVGDWYNFDVTWGDESVSGAPWRLNLIPPNADNVFLAEPPSGMVEAGQPVGICFDTSGAGNGELTATCRGARVGEIPITVSERAPEKYDVKFTPIEPDIYDINVLWSGKHVKGSPFQINLMPVDVSKVQVEGPTQPNGLTGPVEVMLRTSGAGRGKVAASCRDSKNKVIPATVKETSNENYLVSFTPPRPDIYAFQVQYGGFDVKGSPFYINTLPPDASKVKVTEPQEVKLSEPVVFKVDARNAGSGELEAHCRGVSYGAVQPEIVQEAIGEFIVSFTPHHADSYSLALRWAGDEVPNSPFQVDLRPAQADKVRVKEQHIPDEAGTGEPAWVDLDCSAAGSGEVTGRCRGDKVGDVPVVVQKTGRSDYRVKFQPPQADKYNFDVFFGGKNVPGSPFPINLIPPQPDMVELLKMRKPARPGDSASLEFDTSKAGRGTMRAEAHGDLVGSVPVQVTQKGPDRFNVAFAPPKPDCYKVDVFWGDKPVAGSPFTIDTRPKVRPDKVVCGQPEYTVSGKPVSLAVDATEAGEGALTATCAGELAGEVPCEVTATSDSTYSVSCLPTREDIYTLSVFYAGTEVNDSPFMIDLRPKGPVNESVGQRIIEQPVESMMIPEDWVSARPESPPLQSLPNEFTNYIGEPTNLTVESEEDQKGAQLIATAVGEKYGPVDIKVTKGADGTFDVCFNPEKPDRYTLDAKLNGESVPTVPFIVKYIQRVDPSKCYIFGLADIPAIPEVDKPIVFGVDATDAGEGKLSVTADGPSAEGEDSTLDVKAREDNPRIYDISYTPSAAGLHRVHLVWAKQAIPGSPLQFMVGDASAIPTYAYGKPIALDINADCKLGDLEAFAIHEDTGARYKVKISKGAEKGKFKLAFQPREPGIYAVHVQLKGKDIPGSPYRVRYAKPADAGAVNVVGLDDHCYVGEPLAFTVDGCEAGSGDLKVRASAPTDGKDADFEVHDNKNGTYSAVYTPHSAGDHYIDIMWGGAKVPNSPFHVSVRTHPPEVRKALKGNDTVNIIPVGQTAEIQLKDFSGRADEDDYLVVQCVGKNSGEAAVAIEKEGDGSFLIRFTPTVADDYTLNVKLGQEHVEESPFFIKAVDRQVLSEDFEHPSGVCHGDVQVGKPVNVLVPYEGFKRKEDLEVRNHGPTGPCMVTVNDKLQSALGLEFTPEAPGDYVVSAKEDGNAIGNSPYKIRALPQLPDASKVHIIDDDMHIFEKVLPFGRPARFSISTKDAGPGTLNITSRGPGKAEVKVFDNRDSTYTCEFMPSVAGKYHIDILWNDEHIPGSPFTLNFRSKKSRVITGLNLEDESFRIGVPHRFKLHCEEVGDGILELKCKPASAAQVRLIPIEGQNSYSCEILPVEIGNHQIVVQYSAKHILGSPFNVQFELRGDASKVKMVESAVEHEQASGDNVNFCISTEGAGKGSLTASVVNTGTKESQDVSVTQIADDRYNVEFSPGDGTEYLLTIKYDDQHILGSPFKLVFGPPAIDASLCTAEGDGLVSALVEKWSKFVVNAEKAGAGDLAVEIKGEDGGFVPSRITAVSEGVHEVSYMPQKAGNYSISVLWSGGHIPDSPFAIRCYHPADPSLLNIPSPVNELLLGRLLEFEVKSSSKTEGELTSFLQSNQNKTFPIDVRQESQENFICSTEPPAPGKYMVHVRWNGEHIQGSPFKLKVLTPPRPDMVRAYGPGLENGHVGQEGNFTVETAEGGAGTLAVRVHGPKGAFKINMRRHPDSDRTILVRYDPTHVGQYTVDITWSDTHIPGSPFKVDILEQQK